MHCIKALLIAMVVSSAATSAAQAITAGQVDDFEDGTTQGWTVGLGGQGQHPAPPENVLGGQGGADDNFLKLSALGGQGIAGSRLSAINFLRWGGDYSGLGITRIGMDLINLGNEDLVIRLFLENPDFGPPQDTAITHGFSLPSGSGWVHAQFSVAAADLTALEGDVGSLLPGVTALRILHNPDESYPPPDVVTVLGVDNISAVAISAPASLALVVTALFAVFPWRRRQASC